ncbi:hypothetical protein ACFY1P_20250 [Streptomyces sp. NPDC001407]|uniref:hypothetical protein n=1 Tax=Streptomyces sp. NPDC001407 TaxID=3364573 RepID=UPI0036A6E34C
MLFDPRFTVLVLPGGRVHANGKLLSGPELWPLIHQAWHVPREAAARLGYPVRISVGRPDGSVSAYLMSGDGGHTRVAAHPELVPLMAVDPRWSDGVLGRHPLLASVRAAETTGDFSRVRRAARNLTDHLERGVGTTHPYSVMARELEGHFALLDHDGLGAAAHFTSAAETRYRIQAPAQTTSCALDTAVAAFLAAVDSRAPGAWETGYRLAHTLVHIAPRGTERIAAVLERLGPACLEQRAL